MGSQRSSYAYNMREFIQTWYAGSRGLGEVKINQVYVQADSQSCLATSLQRPSRFICFGFYKFGFSFFIQVSGNGPSPPKYLNAVCMFCCTGMKSAIVCRCCRGEWSGIDLVLGSCYNYDIFAASQCCPERRQVRN